MPDRSLANILVVDDSEAICKALHDVLTLSGYAVRTAPSGERAMQILETAQMDLIISDLKMSGMSGLQLLKLVKEKYPSLPFIILTGFGDMDNVIEAMRCGVADYLKKPFSVEEVLKVTERELKKPKRVLTTVTATAPGATEKPQRVFVFSAPDMERIDRVLSDLRAQTTAESVLLVEEAGYVISAKGMLSESDLPALTALMVAGRATNSQLAFLLRESTAFALHYLEGQRVAVYTSGLGRGLFLVVVVPRTVKQGAVWVYTKKATSEIEKLVEGAAVQAKAAAPPADGKPPLDAPALHAEMATQLDNVFSQPAAQAGAELADSVQTLTFEEAMAQGLLGNMKLDE